MALPEFLRILRQRWAIIAAVTAAVVALAGGLTAISPTVYQATSTLFVSVQSGSSDSEALALVQAERLDSYAELASSDTVLDAVIQELDLERSAASLRADTAIARPAGSVLIDVAVRDRDPEIAADVANAIGEEVILLVDELESRGEGRESPIEVSLVEPAQAPESAASPNAPRNLLFGLVMGLALGIAAAIVREILDTRIHDPELLRDQLGLPLLAIVQEDKQAKTRPLLLDKPMLDAGDDQAQLGELWSRSHVTEAFRHLRTNLQFFDFESRGRSILVTSAAPGEGKTTVAGDLAITMGLAGESVALVDCDLRRPSVEKYLQVLPGEGLTDILIGRAELDHVLLQNERLTLLPVGTIPPNPSELLGSQAMADLLAELHNRFDAIVVDSPPAAPFADPAVLASICGATLLVVRMDSTDQRDLERALASLEAAQARVCGFVANRANIGRRTGHYYGYYGYRGTEAPAAMIGPEVTPRSFNGPARRSQRSTHRSGSAEQG